MSRHSFQPRNSLFPCFSLYFPTLRALLREISPFYFLRTPLFALREGFSNSAFPFLHPLLHLHLRIYSPSVPHSPRPSPPSPTFFLIPPHFSISLPNKRTIARTTRVRVRLHLPTRQEVFVYCLHRFTHPSQSTVHQHIRCEEKQEKAFTKCTTDSQSTFYHKHPISSTVNSICHCGEPHHPHREHKNKKSSPLTRCATTICDIPVKR